MYSLNMCVRCGKAFLMSLCALHKRNPYEDRNDFFSMAYNIYLRLSSHGEYRHKRFEYKSY